MDAMGLSADHIHLQHWIRDRDADAFGHLAKSYSGMVFGTCLRITRNKAEAEDVTQECFETLANVSEVPQSPIGAWLHRVATYRALNKIKAQKRRMDREMQYAIERTDSVEPEWKDIDALVDAAISELPEELRVPVVAHFLEGKSYTSIAESLDTSRQLITHRTNKGLRLLRKALKKRGVPVALSSLAVMMTTHFSESVAVPIATSASIGKIAVAGTVYQTSAGTAAAATAATATTGIGTTLLGGIAMTNSTILTAGAVATLVAAGALYTVNQSDESPSNPTSQSDVAADTSVVDSTQMARIQENLGRTDAERIRLQRQLAAANEQLATLESSSVSKEPVGKSPTNVEDNGVSMDAVREQVHNNSGAVNHSKSMTELVFSEFLYAAELEPELLKEVKSLIENSYLEITALQQFAKLEGDQSFGDVRQGKLDERISLDGLMKDRFSDDTYDDWTAFTENIDSRETYATLTREMKPYTTRLNPEIRDAVMQIAVEEAMTGQTTAEESNLPYNDIERIQGSLRLFDSMRHRFQEYLSQDQFAQLGNWLTMMENTSLRRLNELKAQ